MGQETPRPVTVIGLGPMGRAMAAAFLAAGQPTTVWNRTAGKADELLARGATCFEVNGDHVNADRSQRRCICAKRIRDQPFEIGKVAEAHQRVASDLAGIGNDE